MLWVRQQYIYWCGVTVHMREMAAGPTIILAWRSNLCTSVLEIKGNFASDTPIRTSDLASCMDTYVSTFKRKSDADVSTFERGSDVDVSMVGSYLGGDV